MKNPQYFFLLSQFFTHKTVNLKAASLGDPTDVDPEANLHPGHGTNVTGPC